jgi:hypothetical protein
MKLRWLPPLALLPLLAGCPTGPASDGGTGVVIKREAHDARNGPKYYVVTIHRDHGGDDSGRVSKSVYWSCSKGKRWPDCREAVR